MKKISLILLIAFVFVAVGFSQSYISAGGIRVGTGVGFTLKQKIAKRTTLEGLLNSSFLKKQFQITLLGEQHFPLLSRRINLYLGAGVHKAWNFEGESSSINPYGISTIIGAEITLRKLNISYDFQPSIHLRGDRIFDYHSAISLRYVFYQKTVTDRIKDGHQKRKKNRIKKRKKRRKNRDKKKRKKDAINWRFWE